MVKEVPVSISISGCTAQDYYNAIYGEGGSAFKQYHQEHSNCPDASVTAWDSGRRQVRFRMTLNLPQLLKKAIGTECIEVLETQCITWHDNDRFTVESEPNLNFPGSSKFVTKGKTTVYTVNGCTCQVDAVLVCSANMPWPMQSTVEAAMATEAQAGVSKFLQFAVTYCTRSKELARASPPSPLPPATPDDNRETEALFYDALEAGDSSSEAGSSEGPTEAGAGGTSNALALATTSGVAAPRTPAQAPGTRAAAGSYTAYTAQGLAAAGRGEELLLVAVRELQHTSRTMCVTLAEVVAQLKAVNEQVGAIRAAVAPHSTSSIKLQNGPTAVGGYSVAARGSAAPSYAWWLSGLALGASAAGLVYLRTRQRVG